MRRSVQSSIVKRSIVIDGVKTSISLEDQFWEALREIAKERGLTLSKLVGDIGADRGNANLSSAVRLFVLHHYQDQVSARQRKTWSA
jgi:predicted DNA-binding ribbon-helix-helix protein